MRKDEMNELIEIKKKDIKFEKLMRLYFDGGMTLISSVFIALGCVFSPLWLLGLLTTIPSFVLAHVPVSIAIKQDKKKLKEMIEERNRTNSSENIYNFEYQKDETKSSKANKSMIASKIENIESKEDDLTI